MEANRFVRLGAQRRLDGVAAWCADWLLSERRCLADLVLFGFQGVEGSAMLEVGVEVALGRGRSNRFRYRLFPDGAGSCH